MLAKPEINCSCLIFVKGWIWIQAERIFQKSGYAQKCWQLLQLDSRSSGGLMDNYSCMGVSLVTRVTLLPRCHARQVSRVTCHVAATHRGTNLWPASLQLQHSSYVLVMKWFQGCWYIHCALRHWGFVMCNVKCSAHWWLQSAQKRM